MFQFHSPCLVFSPLQVEDKEDDQISESVLEKALRLRQAAAAARAQARRDQEEEDDGVDSAASRVLREVKAEPIKMEEEDNIGAG